MEQYIDKSALVAETERRIRELEPFRTEDNLRAHGAIAGYYQVLSFIHTLEVKEVDLEHEVEYYWKQCDMTWCRDAYSMTHIRSMLSDIAKHFYELGLSVNNKAEKEVDLELITGWFDHIAQIADDRMTLTNQRMTDAHALDEIKCLAKDSSEFIKTHYKVQKGEEV